jgi:phosphohistidine phosphatase
MKTLLLMRHAKSSWKDTELNDIDRPLNKRGKKDAPLMGTLLKEKELVPQIILSSPAVRARQTAELLAAACGFVGDVQYLDNFYLAEPAAYVEGLVALPDEIERAMLIGHNPGLEGLLQMISGRIESLPTSTIAYLSVPISSWRELHGDTEGELLELLLPREADEEEEKKAHAHEKEREKEKEKEKEREKEKEKEKEREREKEREKEKEKEKKKGKGKK